MKAHTSGRNNTILKLVGQGEPALLRDVETDTLILIAIPRGLILQDELNDALFGKLGNGNACITCLLRQEGPRIFLRHNPN